MDRRQLVWMRLLEFSVTERNDIFVRLTVLHRATSREKNCKLTAFTAASIANQNLRIRYELIYTPKRCVDLLLFDRYSCPAWPLLHTCTETTKAQSSIYCTAT